MKPIIALLFVFIVLSVGTARSQSQRSVWDGVYTEAQAVRGQAVFTASCSSCHSVEEFSGDAFMGAWDASTALDLFSTVQAKMPMDNPGSLQPEQYADVIAYFFRGNKFPAGKDELTTDQDQLKLIRIERKK
jgi:mono/diheme cytochrome c family protein